VILRQFASASLLSREILAVAAQAEFRHLRTRGGVMSVAMTNCGSWGWHSDLSGYRYVARDPLSDRAWPDMPPLFAQLARDAAATAGFGAFDPDCCLINRYAVGAQMGTHRDFDEHDLSQPIVSVSIGLPAVFCWYGAARSGKPLKVPLSSGDVLVWGASARTGYHAVRRVAAALDEGNESFRYNLTFRRAR
jgi:alkylated DNA repair protein (DNA oxidative demethylase)